jgi:CxxC motif-containing protein (DUF1111 family)
MRRKSNSIVTTIRVGLPVAVFVAAIVCAPNQGQAQLPPPPPVGGPLAGLTPAEAQRFNAGRGAFLQNENPQTGLGPVFNGTSCAQCHAAAAPGGASPSLGVSVVTRIGGTVNGTYSDLADFGGALIQARSLREIIPNYPVPREVVPAQATFVTRRITTPLFGDGLIEAIPASVILSRQDPTDVNHDGISGRGNFVTNVETRATELGRFGWKAQVSSIHVFAGDAYLNEMGITSPFFPTEVKPQGKAIPPGADQVADPEDNGGDVNRLADYMRLLAPPQVPIGTAQGRALFTSTGCAACHTPSMTTGASVIAALANKPVNLNSDLLLHDMGPQLADRIQQGQATGSEFRSAPLWGIHFRHFLLHDGRAQSVDQAIRLHGGEAASTVSRYITLTQPNRDQLLQFVQGL